MLRWSRELGWNTEGTGLSLRCKNGMLHSGSLGDDTRITKQHAVPVSGAISQMTRIWNIAVWQAEADGSPDSLTGLSYSPDLDRKL
jgi:hypothetical protein